MDSAMVLAAGLGTRFRAVSGELPKPLVSVAGKPLLDWTLDMLAAGGVSRAVVNVHYKADLVETHLQARQGLPRIKVSDEREELLETGGGLIKATPLLDDGPVFCTNTDAIFALGSVSPVDMLRSAWQEAKMDALLALVPVRRTSGYDGEGDFAVSSDGRLSWSGTTEKMVFTGLQIIHPRLWAGQPIAKQSTKVFWDRAMEAGRIFGVVYEGDWLHVGDPPGFAAAEERLGQP